MVPWAPLEDERRFRRADQLSARCLPLSRNAPGTVQAYRASDESGCPRHGADLHRRPTCTRGVKASVLVFQRYVELICIWSDGALGD